MGEGEEFLLKWNDYQHSFSLMVQSLCLSQEMFDCTLSTPHRKFSVHRMVLSTCSSYFRSLFAGVESHQHPVIVLSDVEEEMVELLVRYMYTGQVGVAEDKLIPLVKLAKTLHVKGLIDVPIHENENLEEKSVTSLSTASIATSKLNLPTKPVKLDPEDLIDPEDIAVDPSSSDVDQSVSISM